MRSSNSIRVWAIGHLMPERRGNLVPKKNACIMMTPKQYIHMEDHFSCAAKGGRQWRKQRIRIVCTSLSQPWMINKDKQFEFFFSTVFK